MHPNSLPVSDSAYVAYKEIEYESSSYYGILNLVRKSAFERKFSFVLKYIDIGGLKLASGERALLNFFSWLYIVPYFRCIDTSLETSLRDNILLLIDEIDLYCHPSTATKTGILFDRGGKGFVFGKKCSDCVYDTQSHCIILHKERHCSYSCISFSASLSVAIPFHTRYRIHAIRQAYSADISKPGIVSNHLSQFFCSFK